MDFTAVLTFFAPLLHTLQMHQWLPAIALVSSYVVMLLDRDSRFPISLPASWDENRWKPVTIVVASVVQAAIVALVPKALGGGGMDWQHVLVLGFQAAFFSFGLWALVVKALYGDKVPQWLLWISMALPKPKPLPSPGTPVVLGDVTPVTPVSPVDPPKAS